MTPSEFVPIDPVLENAVEEIRNESVDPAVIEAAAARVWSRLAPEVTAASPIRGCADFQALLPDFRAHRLPAARTALVQDHLHECVVCRRVYHGPPAVMPAPKKTVRFSYQVRWAVAAAVVATAGVSVWLAIDQFGSGTGRAVVETANGRLFYLAADGIHPLAAGQDLPDGLEIRTGNESGAMLRLRDGSEVEMRDHSGFSTSQAGADLSIRLDRGSVLVHAAKRRKGHLYVSTADCRVAVTGTIFSVSAGVKGSRVSVVEGEVHVTQENREKVLHPGDQTVTSPSIEPVPVREDISWSRDHDRLYKALDALKSDLRQIHLPALRYQSGILAHLPASTAFFASIPNLSAYLGEADAVLHSRLAESPELRAWWDSRGADIDPVLEKLRAGSDYLGDEIDIVAIGGPDGKTRPPALIAETRRDGFADFLHRNAPQLDVEAHGSMVVFGPVRDSVAALAASLDSPAGMPGTPFFQRIQESFKNGAGILFSADLSRLGSQPLGGVRFLMFEQKEVEQQMQISASLGFDGPRTGMAAWLAEPSAMGSLDYISPDATLVFAAAVKSPAAILDETVGLQQRSPAGAQNFFDQVREQAGFDVHEDLAASLGNEFSISLDGPAFPVPSVKLVAEVYDPARFQATVQKAVAAYNQHVVAGGPSGPGKPLRTSQETFEGRTYYMIGGADPNPLTEVHYTYADGYLIASLSRAVVARALQVKTTGASISHSARFVALEPRDRHDNFSMLMYQNLGTTLAPLTGLLGAFIPQGGPGQANALQHLGNLKPLFLAAYGEPDRITIAGQGDALAKGIDGIVSGNIMGVVGNVLPLAQFSGTSRPRHALSR